ncbi:MAG: MerR family transcriptional regulator [Nitrospiria bacterium]
MAYKLLILESTKDLISFYYYYDWLKMETKTYCSEEVCRLLNLSYYQLEYWILVGLAKPIMEHQGLSWSQRFSEEDVHFLKEVKSLTDKGYFVSRAAEMVRGSRLPEASWRTS